MSKFARLWNRLADFFFIRPIIPLWRQRLKGKLMIYLYHRIGEEGEHRFLDQGGSPVTPLAEFAHDIEFLKRQGAKFIRICDIGRIDFDSNTFYVAISFDDGFRSNYEQALVCLNQQRIPCTIFQVSSMIENQELLWEHKLYFCGTHPKLSVTFWAQLQSLNPSLQHGDFTQARILLTAQSIVNAADNVLENEQAIKSEMDSLAKDLYPSESQLIAAQESNHEIASHGHRHYFRDTINSTQFEQDLQESKKVLADIGIKQHSFSYPFNRYVPEDEQIAQNYYQYISTVDAGVVDASTRYTKLPRNTWPGLAKNNLRRRRWLLTGHL